MASDETMTLHSSLQDEDFDDDIDDGFGHHHDHDDHDQDQHPQTHNLSRLSVCTSSTLCGVDDDDDDDDVDNSVSMFLSHLSIESFEGDADGELSDGKEIQAGLCSDSENEELGGCYSLPATPPRRRNRGKTVIAVKDYASDNEAAAGKGTVFMRQETKKNDPRRRRSRSSRRIRRDGWLFEPAANYSKKKEEEEEENLIQLQGFSGESDQSGGGGGSTGTGVMVITRPKGGKRSLCMDLEEVKACRDLGFELEHERMLEMPSHLSFSNSTLDTSSGSNSPIANMRISSPGDDPRDVKARLKVWAQAVALASASKYST
ncbi:uncharacterized protein LOC133309459 [Gastrolobium bilobum]|uniref:uncharacterized protein LOC133309459 n=1 Tax=Gastrolobium bilobum TaxID=150636 RepID=UPI002AB0BD09|nr:uncharacterized protein LOC133309459 [Gastrolobium bilobum]